MFDNILSKLTSDKVQHFLFGALFAVLAASIVFAAGKASPLFLLLACVLFALLVGLVKEWYDYLDNKAAIRVNKEPPHTVDWKDAAATALGGLYVGLTMAAGVALARHLG